MKPLGAAVQGVPTLGLLRSKRDPAPVKIEYPIPNSACITADDRTKVILVFQVIIRTRVTQYHVHCRAVDRHVQ